MHPKVPVQTLASEGKGRRSFTTLAKHALAMRPKQLNIYGTGSAPDAELQKTCHLALRAHQPAGDSGKNSKSRSSPTQGSW